MTIYGLVAEFEDADAVVKATEAVRAQGFTLLEAYAPYPVEGLAEAVGFEKNGVAFLTLVGGLSGATLGFLMQWYANSVDYPINVAGRPDFSWPSFIPITFELGVLGAALSAAFGMLALNRLPKLWHPIFEHPSFVRASRDRFFLCVEGRDPIYDTGRLRSLVKPFRPVSLEEVHLED